jgi:hypothetical protein
VVELDGVPKMLLVTGVLVTLWLMVTEIEKFPEVRNYLLHSKMMKPNISLVFQDI